MIKQSQTERFHEKLLRKLESVTGLTDEEKRAITALPFLVREVSDDRDVISIGDKPTHCCVVIEGWACRYKMTPHGRRQIMSFHIPGDIPDLQSLYIETMDHSLSALTPLTVGLIPHRDVIDLIRRHEGIARALWRDSLVEAAIFREWMVGIGRRSAHERIAHQFCEMATKARSVGLNDGDVYPWPVTQEEIADSLGLSDVHVNRVLRDLRRDGLVDVGRRFLTVHDWKRLAVLGQFDPQYLHLVSREAA
jgi:CRP-like cAMP-binding protein